MSEPETFDCFLSHNSRDKPAVRALAEALRERGISVWLDEERLRPGTPWQSSLEAGIRASRSVAVLVGASGFGPREEEEMQAALSFALKKKRPVIPVLLADAPAKLDLPLFLGTRTWVDMRSEAAPGNLSALERLIWGITGNHPDGTCGQPGPHGRDDDRGAPAPRPDSIGRTPTTAEWRELARDQLERLAHIETAILLDSGLKSRHGARLVDLDDPRLVELGIQNVGRTGRRRWSPLRLTDRLGLTAPPPPLDRALARARTSPLVLIGDAGAGKSVSLRRLAGRRLLRAQNWQLRHRRMPLYVHLGALDLPLGAVPSAADLRAKVLKQAAQGSETIAARLDAWFDWGLERRRWLILLDAFDEIPDLLGRTATRGTVAAYAQAVIAFARDCPGAVTLIASRPLPGTEELNWTRWPLAPLDHRQQRRVLAGWFPKRKERAAVERELIEHEAALADSLANPFYLSLIAGFRADLGRLPHSLGEALAGFIDRRLQRIAEADRNEPGVEAIGEAAAGIALAILTAESRDQRHDLDSLAAALAGAPWADRLPPAMAMTLLYKGKLGRIEGSDKSRGRRFAFRHRRILEYLALRALAPDPTRLSAEPSADPDAPVSVAELLEATAWREVTAGLLACPAPPPPLVETMRGRLQALADAVGAQRPDDLGTAGALEAHGTLDPQGDFTWPAGARRLLDILQRGAAAGGTGDPATALAADHVLFAAWLRGAASDRAEALSLARAGSTAGLTGLLEAGFASWNSELARRSFEQAMGLAALSERLIAPMRRMLVARWATGTPDPGGPTAMQRRLERLDQSGQLGKAFRMVRTITPIDRLIFAVGVLSLAASAWLTLDSITAIDLVGLAAFIYWPVIGIVSSLLSSGWRETMWTKNFVCRSVDAVRCVWRRRLTPLLLDRITLLAWISAFGWIVRLILNDPSSSISGHRVEPSMEQAAALLGLPWVFAVIWLFWGLCAPLAALSGRMLSASSWPLLPALPLILLRDRIRRGDTVPKRTRPRTAESTLLFILKMIVVFTGLTGLLAPWQSSPHEGSASPDYALWARWHYWPFILGAIPLLTSQIFDTLLALRLILARSPVSIPALLSACARPFALVGQRGRMELLYWGLKTPRFVIDEPADQFVSAVIDAIERDARNAARLTRRQALAAWWRGDRPPPKDDWPEAVKIWYRTYARRGSGVAYLDGVVLQDLIALRERIRARLDRETP